MTYNYSKSDKDKLIEVKTNDKAFKVRKKELMISDYFKRRLNRGTSINLNIPSKSLNLIIKYCKHHWNKENESEINMLKKNMMSNISDWDKIFLDEIKEINPKKDYKSNIIKFINIVKFFEIQKLYELCTLKISMNITKRNSREIKKVLNIASE